MAPFLRTPAVLALIVLAGARLASQDGPEQPVFRSGVDLVTVDVSVVGEGGRPVEGLGAEAFTVRVDGVPRRVVRALYVPYAATAESAPAPSPHFSSNEEVDAGRLLLLVVDQQHIRRVEGLAALRAASEFIDQLDSADRVAAAPLDHIGPIHFTNDHGGVKAYLQTLAGTASSLRGQFTLGLVEALAIGDGNRTWLDRAVLRECGEPLSRFESTARIAENNGMRDPCPVQLEQESRALAQETRANARTSLNQLMGLIARLAGIEGPKTLVFISEGLVAEPSYVDLTALGAAAQAARVTVYVLQLEQPMFDASESIVSPTLAQDLQVRGDGLARLAGSARGAHFRLVGGDPYPFRRILRELSGYYLLAFEASPADRDGRTRRIDIRTSAPGTTVRARPAFRSSPATLSRDGEAQIVRLLRTPRLATELPVRATTHTLRDPADHRMRVVVSAEAGGGDADVTFGYVLIDASGVIAASGRDPASAGRLSEAVTVPAGRYTLRVAAIDAAGRAGSVEHAFLAALQGTGGAGVSDLVLTESAPGEALRPVVSRAAASRLNAVLEIYGAPGWTPDGLAVRLDVRASGGTDPVLTLPAKVKAVSGSTWRARADLDILELPAGQYVVTAHVEQAGTAVGRVQRGFTK